MSRTLLVNPVRPCGATADRGFRDRLIPSMLRAGVAASRALTGGRGVGWACTVAARLMGADGQVLFRLQSGGTLCVRSDDRYWLPYLLLDGVYETDLDHFLSRALTSSDAFLDCGANLGLWSIAAARVINDPRRVVAVEAAARTFAQLAKNNEANGQTFTVRHRAVGRNSGEQVSFFASVGDHASATLVEGLSPGDARKESVTTVSLLDLVGEQTSLKTAADALIFVKLDIEGMEREVFSTIDPDRHGDLAILFEDHGGEPDHVTAFVLERGFHVAFLADDGAVEPIRKDNLHRLDALKTDAARGYNLLAFAPRGAAAARIAKLFKLDTASGVEA